MSTRTDTLFPTRRSSDMVGDGRLTPPLDGTILAGITRDSVLRLLRADGVRVSEHRITLDQLAAAGMAGQLGTAFGVGTAARLVSIDEISDGTTAIRSEEHTPELQSLMRNSYAVF